MTGIDPQPGVPVSDRETNGSSQNTLQCLLFQQNVNGLHLKQVELGLLALSALNKSFSLGDNFSCWAEPHPVQKVGIMNQRIPNTEYPT